MAEIEFEKGVTIRTTRKAQRALNRVVAAVKSSDRVVWKGGIATKEAIANAIWLWLDEMDEDALIEAMSLYVPKLESLMKGETPGPAAVAPPPQVDFSQPDPRPEPKRNRRRSG